MLFVLLILSLTLNVLTTALPTISDLSVKADLTNAPSEHALSARQIVTAGASVQCCETCGAAYDYSTFWQSFDNLCTWAGKGLELWSTQTYYTGDYYCPVDSEVCMHMEIQFNCFKADGNGYASPVDYDGCMGYFEDVITPADVCGGSPYPGGQVTSEDGCWMFQATADGSSDWNTKMALMELECDESRRWCTKPGFNETVDTYVGPEHRFGTASLSEH